MRDGAEHVVEDEQGRALGEAEQRLDPGQVAAGCGARQDGGPWGFITRPLALTWFLNR